MGFQFRSTLRTDQNLLFKKISSVKKTSCNIEKMGKKKHVDVDAILEKIGGFGIWQKTTFLLLCCTAIVSGVSVVTYIFTAYIPDYRCIIPHCRSQETTYLSSI